MYLKCFFVMAGLSVWLYLIALECSQCITCVCRIWFTENWRFCSDSAVSFVKVVYSFICCIS